MKRACLLGLIVLAVSVFAGNAEEPEDGRPLTTTLTGGAEVPPADPDGGGTARITLNPGKQEVCFKLSVTNIGPATAAHIHEGSEGSTGPAVVTLTPPPTDGFSNGCVSAERDVILEIIRDPGKYYVNVHNQEYPNGAVRGQLSRR